ncbi:MAG: outer membrane beta-barrel protein [Bacteroidetes bacterium]|nr:outer membrane beta-barrel protein [Bacteroidota bacterium]
MNSIDSIKMTVALICICFTPGVHAQQFRAEMTAGIVGSQVSGDQLGGFNKAGLLAGIGVRTNLSEKTEAGFRMLYLQKGSRKPLKNDGTDSAFYLLRLNYIELPFTIRYHATKNFSLEAGPSLGYLIKSYEEDENGELNFRQPFYDWDFNFNISLVYQLNKNFDFMFGYWQSILPIREHSSGAVYRLNRGQFSSMISFSVLYTIRKSLEKEQESGTSLK